MRTLDEGSAFQSRLAIGRFVIRSADIERCAFGPGNVVLETDNIASLQSQTFTLSSSGISYIQFNNNTGGSDSWLFDVGFLQANVSATPLPSAWTMMLIGFLGLGFFAYRGANKNAVATA